MGKFKKGLILGGLLGAGTMWLCTTKQGGKLCGKVKEHSGEVYKRTKDKIMSSDAYKDMSQKEFVKEVKELADKYAEEKDLEAVTKQAIIKIVSDHWDNVKKDIESRGKDKFIIDQ